MTRRETETLWICKIARAPKVAMSKIPTWLRRVIDINMF